VSVTIEAMDIQIGDYLYAIRPPSEHYKNNQLRVIRVVGIYPRYFKDGVTHYEIAGVTATPTGRMLYANSLFWTFKKLSDLDGVRFEEEARKVRRRY
jgi:hypothetical protein